MSANVIDGQVEPEIQQRDNALVVAGEIVNDQIMVRRDPVIVLAEARKAAVVLTEVIASKKRKVMFNGEQYIENEDWQTIARFYGLTARIESDTYVEYAGAAGFEAVAVAVDVNGMERSRAIAMCLNDEDNWGQRTVYGYSYLLKDGTWTDPNEGEPDRALMQWEEKPGGGGSRPVKKRVTAGSKPTPMFQLRSMAQTRACSKALRQILGFVPVLAGYRPTPAEELQVEVVQDPGDQGDQQAGRPAVGQQGAGPATGQPQPAGQGQTSAAAAGQGQRPTVASRQGPSPAQAGQQARPAAPAGNGGNGNGDTRVISEAQGRRLWAIAKNRGLDEDAVSTGIEQRWNYERTTDIQRRHYDQIINWIEAGAGD